MLTKKLHTRDDEKTAQVQEYQNNNRMFGMNLLIARATYVETASDYKMISIEIDVGFAKQIETKPNSTHLTPCDNAGYSIRSF